MFVSCEVDGEHRGVGFGTLPETAPAYYRMYLRRLFDLPSLDVDGMTIHARLNGKTPTIEFWLLYRKPDYNADVPLTSFADARDYTGEQMRRALLEALSKYIAHQQEELDRVLNDLSNMIIRRRSLDEMSKRLS